MLEFIIEGKIGVSHSREVLSSGAPISIAIPDDSNGIGVVLIPDIFGLRDLVDETIIQLSTLGLSVIAVEQFSHIFDDLSVVSREDKFAHIKEMDDTAQCADILAAGQLLRTRHNCNVVNLIGFCIGGMYAFKCAGTSQFDNVVSCYGMISLPDGWKSEVQKEPMDYVKQESCSRLLAIIGGCDFGYAKDNDVDNLEDVINSDHHKHLGSEVVIFPEAGHAFMHDPTRPEYRSDDAKAAWSKALEFMNIEH